MSSHSVGLSAPAKSPQFDLWGAYAVLMLILMEISWITPAYSLIVGWSLGGSALTAFLVFGAIYLASSLVATVLKQFDVVVGIIQAALLVILMLGTLWATGELIYHTEQVAFNVLLARLVSNLISFSIPIKPELLLAIVVFLLWRRGFSMANRNIGLGLVGRSFRIGSIVLIISGMFAAILSYPLPFLESGLFLLTSLLAMGGARFSTLGSLRGSKRVAFKREWVFGLTFMAALVMTISVGLGVFAAGPFSAWVGGFLLIAEGYVSSALKVVLAPVINFLGIIFAWFWSLFEPQPEIDPTAVEALEEGLEGPVAAIQQIGSDPAIASFISTLVTVIGVVVLIAVVLYAVRRFRKESTVREPGAEDQMSIAGSLSDYLRSVRNRAQQALGGVANMNPAERLLAAARIRIIYARLLRLSARLGEPRAPATTPIEFLQHLSKVFPGSHGELELITDAYLRVRYGELPETRSQIEAVDAAWNAVRKHR